MWRLFVLFSTFLFASYGHAQQAFNLDSIRLDDSKSIENFSKFCQKSLNEPNGFQATKNLCYKSFYCGDGGCSPTQIVVIIDRNKDNDFMEMLGEIPIHEIHECDPGDDFESQYTTAKEISEGTHAKSFADNIRSKSIKAYCGNTKPGYEIETVIQLRRNSDVVLIAIREGGDAGAPAAGINISRNSFYRYRKNAISELRDYVKQAIEKLINSKCETNNNMTCSIIVSHGRIKLELVVPGTLTSGRPDQWEKSYWEIYPHWTGSYGEYQLYFELPITAIKRWPVTGKKPTGDFKSLDYDEGFESFRFAVMSHIADRIDGAISEGN